MSNQSIISQYDFYHLPEVIAQIEIQKVTPFFNPAHKAAAYRIKEIAEQHGVGEHFQNIEDDYRPLELN